MFAPRLSALVARSLCTRTTTLPASAPARRTSLRAARAASPAAATAAACFFGMSDKLGGLSGLATRAEQPSMSSGARMTTAVDQTSRLGEAFVGDKISAGRLNPPSPGRGGGSGFAVAAGSAGGGGDSSCSPRYATTYLGASDEQGKRNHMEDRHTLLDDFRMLGADPGLPRQFIAVYDGHSSARGSEHASRRVHQFIAAQPAVQQCRGNSCDQGAVEAALKQAFEAVDAEIVQTAVQTGMRYGTTAVCALRIGNCLYIAHAGDSRGILCRDGRAIQLTRDHKPASVPEERRRIEAQGGRIAYEADRVVSNPEGQRQTRLNMSRALGDPDFKAPRRLVEAEPAVARVELRPGADSFLLLGSDGLFEVMDAQQAVDVARKALASHGSPSDAAAEAAADALVQTAVRRGSSDNVTAAVMLMQWKE